MRVKVHLDKTKAGRGHKMDGRAMSKRAQRMIGAGRKKSRG